MVDENISSNSDSRLSFVMLLLVISLVELFKPESIVFI